LVTTTASKLTVAFACDKAAAAGVLAGMTLAEARAMCPGLRAADYVREKDDRSLHALARWMIRFSPVVAPVPPDGIFVDVTGSEKLFGGLTNLIHLVEAALQRYGFSFGIAISSTPAAAWAIASFARQNGQIIGEAELARAVEVLPIAALRLDESIVAALHLLGVEQIGQLQRIPRQYLPARFGSIILTRLDQLFGRIAEPIVSVQETTPIRATLELETNIESLEMLWEIFQRLIADIQQQLRTLGHGAKRLLLELSSRETRPIQKEIHLSKASCNAHWLLNLLRCAGETIKSDVGFSRFSLMVMASQRLTPEQLHFIEDSSQEAQEDFEHLLERLRVRLSPEAVLFPTLAASHLPEQAFSLSLESEGGVAVVPAVLKSRPLYLLPEPEEIQCVTYPRDADDAIPRTFTYHGKQFIITHACGPEKISGIWWEGRNKTREYFDVEETNGRRYWLFRVAENRRWFLHGFFE
jgi:protein ImuB